MSAADGYGILNHITGVDFSVARFTGMGNAKASIRGTGNRTGSTLFFICLMNVLFIISVRGIRTEHERSLL